MWFIIIAVFEISDIIMKTKSAALFQNTMYVTQPVPGIKIVGQLKTGAQMPSLTTIRSLGMGCE